MIVLSFINVVFFMYIVFSSFDDYKEEKPAVLLLGFLAAINLVAFLSYF